MPTKNKGFTLLEILIAMFIFTIVSAILVGVLHSVLTAQGRAEGSAEQFREIEMAWLMLSSDLTQMTDRPVRNETGQQEPALSGSANRIAFTHAGWANPNGTALRSTWQRTEYYVQGKTLIRKSWMQLDRTKTTPALIRPILTKVSAIHFEYLDKDRKFQRSWPATNQKEAQLPRAVRVRLTFTNGNTMSQLYVVNATSF